MVSRVDENLGCSSVGSSCGKDYCSSAVGDLDWIIRNRVGPPFAHDTGITVDPKLCDKARQHSEESAVVIESLGDKILKAAKRCKMTVMAQSQKIVDSLSTYFKPCHSSRRPFRLELDLDSARTARTVKIFNLNLYYVSGTCSSVLGERRK